MDNLPKPRIVVPAAMAILLTFGRNGMLPFEERYLLLDRLMNYFVVIIAPVFALKDIVPRPRNHNLHLLIPLFMLVSWVGACVIVGGPREYWPNHTTLLTIFLSILMATQITRSDLCILRRIVLVLSGIFTICTLVFAQLTLHQIFDGTLIGRLGVDISPANVIIYPRVMYMLIITCFVSFAIDKSVLVRVFSVAFAVIPLIIALATGGRGALVGGLVAALVFLLGVSKTKMKAIRYFTGIVVLLGLGYYVTIAFLPLMKQRISSFDSSGRVDIWSDLLKSNITIFGEGLSASYPHNIFLEFLYNYGIIGLLLFLFLLTTSISVVRKYYMRTHDQEALWVVAALVLQMTAQQFSLDIFYGSLWAAIILPLGFGWDYSDVAVEAHAASRNSSDLSGKDESMVMCK